MIDKDSNSINATESVLSAKSDKGKEALTALFASRSQMIDKGSNSINATESVLSAKSDKDKEALTALFASRSQKQNDRISSEPSQSPKAASSAIQAMLHNQIKQQRKTSNDIQTTESDQVTEKKSDSTNGSPALKDDPEYQKYFKMLKVGLPVESVKHAMARDGKDPDVMNGDHSKPAGWEKGVPLKEDPKYQKYFKMLKIGLPMETVMHAMRRDGLDPSVMNGDHNAPASKKNSGSSSFSSSTASKVQKPPKDTHRRTRLHWDTVPKVRHNSVWALVNQDPDVEDINIDEKEFAQLFQAELTSNTTSMIPTKNSGTKKRTAVKVIDPKRANNGGIILARIKVSYEEMAVAIDKM